MVPRSRGAPLPRRRHRLQPSWPRPPGFLGAMKTSLPVDGITSWEKAEPNAVLRAGNANRVGSRNALHGMSCRVSNAHHHAFRYVYHLKLALSCNSCIQFEPRRTRSSPGRRMPSNRWRSGHELKGIWRASDFSRVPGSRGGTPLRDRPQVLPGQVRPSESRAGSKAGRAQAGGGDPQEEGGCLKGQCGE